MSNNMSTAGLIVLAVLAFGPNHARAQYARPVEVPMPPAVSAPAPIYSAPPPPVVCALGTPGCPGYVPPAPPPAALPPAPLQPPCQPQDTRPGC